MAYNFFSLSIMQGLKSRTPHTCDDEPADLGGNYSDTSENLDVRSVKSDDSDSSIDAVAEEFLDTKGKLRYTPDPHAQGFKNINSKDPEEARGKNNVVLRSNQQTNKGGTNAHDPINTLGTTNIDSDDVIPTDTQNNDHVDSGESDNVAMADIPFNVDIDAAYQYVQMGADKTANKEATALVNLDRYIAQILLFLGFVNALYMQGNQVVRDATTKFGKDLLARFPIFFGELICLMKKDNFQLGKMVRDRDAQLLDKAQQINNLNGMLQTALSNKNPATEELIKAKKDKNLAITQLHTSRTESARLEQRIRELTERLRDLTERYQKLNDYLQYLNNEQNQTSSIPRGSASGVGS